MIYYTEQQKSFVCYADKWYCTQLNRVHKFQIRTLNCHWTTFFQDMCSIIQWYMSQKTVSMTFLTDCCARNVLSTSDSECFNSMDCLFNSGSQWATNVQPICKLFFTKACFSVHITYSLVKFNGFYTQLPKIWVNASVKAENTHFDFKPYLIGTKLIFLRDQNNFCYKTILNNAEFTFKDTNSEKNLLHIYWLRLGYI